MEETEVTLAPATEKRQIAIAIVRSKEILETVLEFETEVGKAIGDLQKQRLAKKREEIEKKKRRKEKEKKREEEQKKEKRQDKKPTKEGTEKRGNKIISTDTSEDEEEVEEGEGDEEEEDLKDN
jgi:hypothetical protein